MSSASITGEGQTRVICANQDGERCDQFLCGALELSRSRVAKLIKDGAVTLGGKSLSPSDKVKAGDSFTVILPEPKPCGAVPQDIPIDIVYEDADVCVINKSQGMVVHPAAGNESGTLVNALLFRVRDLSGIGGELRPGIVHRIDKMTSGLLVVAKNDTAHEALAKQFETHSAKRSYIALVHGNFKTDEGTVDEPIGRHPVDRKRMAVCRDGRRAVTHYRVLRRFGACTLLALELETGRTHQIRVHMAFIKHPLLGDELYCSASPVLGLAGQALHGYRLRFTHPSSGKPCDFTAPLPEYFEKALRRLDPAAPEELAEWIASQRVVQTDGCM